MKITAKFVSREQYENSLSKRFCGDVTRYTKSPALVDGSVCILLRA